MALIKPLILGGGLVLIGCGALAAWSPLSSYVRTGSRIIGEHAEQQIPTDFHIERLRTMVADLDSVIGEQNARLVKLDVDLEYLRDETERCDTEVTRLTNEVQRARALLAHEQATYRIGDQVYKRERVTAEARRKAEALQRARALAAAKHETLQTLSTAMSEAEQQLQAARQQRDTYRTRLEQLDAQAEHLAIREELATSIDSFATEGIDRGSFQNVEDTFVRLERQLEVEARSLDGRLDSQAPGSGISFSSEPEHDILDELDAALAPIDAD